MNSLLAANSFGSSCQNRGKEHPVSLTKSMDGFLTAVNQMRSTIMVPSVLKDISYEEVAAAAAAADANPPGSLAPGGTGQKSVLGSGFPESSGSLATLGSSGVAASNDGAAASNGAAASSGGVIPHVVENPDLLLCYKMVDAVSNDLISGPLPTLPRSSGAGNLDGEDSEEIPDEDRFVGFFRGQVQGFMNAIHQMTEMANLLTRKYNESLPGQSPSSN